MKTKQSSLFTFWMVYAKREDFDGTAHEQDHLCLFWLTQAVSFLVTPCQSCKFWIFNNQQSGYFIKKVLFSDL